MGWGLATLSFYRYKKAQTLLARSCILCFETVLGVNKIFPTPTFTSENKKNSKNLFFVCNDILRKVI